jgi:hypothetical protein
MKFYDVPDDHPHRRGIEWAADEGLVKGYPDGTFRPEQAVTRGQLATILWRQAGAPQPEPEPEPEPEPPVDGYPDVPATAVSATPSNFQSVLDSGAAFVVLEPGTYRGAWRLSTPNQTIMARRPGEAVIDGGGANTPWIGNGPNGVTLLGLTVREWMRADASMFRDDGKLKHGLSAVVNPGAQGWRIGWCDLGHTDTILVNWGPGWHIHDTYFHHADRYAIHGGGRNGSKLMERCTWEWVGKLPDRDSLADTNRGGCKFALTSGITIRDLTVRNAYNGVWWDISNENGTLERFTIDNCERTGVNLEISYGPFTVRDGLITRCGSLKRKSEGASWPVPAGVLISLTPDSMVERVRVENSRNGITAIQWDHPNKDPDWTRLGLAGIRVADCHVRSIAEYAYGYTGSTQPGTRAPDVRFTDCTYDSGQLHRGDYERVVKV